VEGVGGADRAAVHAGEFPQWILRLGHTTNGANTPGQLYGDEPYGGQYAQFGAAVQYRRSTGRDVAVTDSGDAVEPVEPCGDEQSLGRGIGASTISR